MKIKKYDIIKKQYGNAGINNENIWQDIPSAIIDKDSYLWLNNGYKPRVEIKVFHTTESICLYFKVYEREVAIKHTEFGSDVWKDSCVEFFINPFPEHSKEYFNIEINALGVPLIGVGKSGKDSKRYYFKQNEINNWEIIPSITEPVNGIHGKEFWTLRYKIPKSFFEEFYNKKINGKKGIANFYKCGDETKYPHFGAWSRIVNNKPNFHLPQFFGEILFL
jgi:hypothetical protein